MKITALKLAAITASAFLCLGLPALGQDVTIDFTGIVNPTVQALGSYAGYYSGTVDGTASTPGFICDDFNDSVFLPTESWQATATSFASLVATPGALNTTLFGSTLNLDGYAAIAYLSGLMAVTPASGQGDIAAAIWYIGAIGSGTNSGPLGVDSIAWSSLDATAQGYVTSLLGTSGEFGNIGSSTSAAIAELEGSSLWIYTPTGNDIYPIGDPFPQEFIGSVAVADPSFVGAPEGGAPLLYLLLGALTCFGLIYLRSRQQSRAQ